ncbi:hypothetical protein P171DRAFT_214584 [Karstenula rhodostoma CBS 690.94]|uniref:Secreted protein n=1 Tax=Karstenula rhodostoma CBS 690.94 TaxID=1392251 RepID=A0A9P4UGH5_9PLEO|nr:hypothetical protein P171DRAFT_214584 [Karstenula rhodostoma CBS 690.94]
MCAIWFVCAIYRFLLLYNSEASGRCDTHVSCAKVPLWVVQWRSVAARFISTKLTLLLAELIHRLAIPLSALPKHILAQHRKMHRCLHHADPFKRSPPLPQPLRPLAKPPRHLPHFHFLHPFHLRPYTQEQPHGNNAIR